MQTYKEEMQDMIDTVINLHCDFCGEGRKEELFIVIPLEKDKEPYTICHYCSGLSAKEDKPLRYK